MVVRVTVELESVGVSEQPPRCGTARIAGGRDAAAGAPSRLGVPASHAGRGKNGLEVNHSG